MVETINTSSEAIILPQTTTKTKIIYASPRLGINLFMGMVDFGLFFLYKEVYQLDSILSGTAIMLGKFSIAIFQFLIAWLSDHTKTKWGRRKPYLFIEAPILATCFVLLLLPGLILGASPPQMTLFAWFATFNVIAQGCYSVTSVYHSWTAEQFPTEERPKVSQIQNIFNFLGMGIVILFTFLVLAGVKDALLADPTKVPTNFLVVVFLFAGIMITLIFLCAFYMPVEKTPMVKTEYAKEFKQLLSNKNFMAMTFIQGFSSLGWSLVNGIMLSYVTIVLGLKSGLNLYIPAGILMIGLLITVQLWRKCIEKFGKKRTLIAIFFLGAIGFPFSLLGMNEWAVLSIPFGILFMGLVASCMAGWGLFPYIVYADLAEDFKKQYGEMKAGLFTGAPAILLNIFQAIGGYILGVMTSDDLPTFTNAPGNSFSIGYVLWGPICAIIFIITIFLIRKYLIIDFAWEKKQK